MRNIPCRQSCGPGEFFDIDTKERVYKCSKCPANTYSSGGGFLISGDLGDWTDAFNLSSPIEKLAWVQ